MKKTIILILFTVCFSNAYNQNDSIRLSLSEAVQVGLSNRFDVKKDSLNINLADNKITRTKEELLPDLSAGSKMFYYGDVQPSIIPAGYLGLTEARKIAIAMPNNTAFELDLSFDIFKPGLYTNIKIGRNDLALEKEKMTQKNNDLRMEISESYCNVLLKRIQFKIAVDNEQRYKDYYNLIKGKYNNGASIESDVMQAELDFKDTRANTEKQEQNYMLSQQELKYRINMTSQTRIILSDSLQTLRNAAFTVDSGVDLVDRRSEIKQLIIEKEGSELQLRRARQAYLPSLSLAANYTQLFQGPYFSYSDIFYWAPVDFVGLRLSVPITGGIRNINSVKDQKIKLLQTDLMIKQKTADIENEIRQAATRLLNAEKNLAEAEDNYSLSQKVYELKKQEYNIGSFSYENLLDTEKSLSTAEQNYIFAVYDFLIARISYQKATGSY